jgi:hypothetical protein
MGAVFVVVADVLGEQATELPIIDHDDVVKQLTAHRADETLRHPVLPKATVTGSGRFDVHGTDEHHRACALEHAILLEPRVVDHVLHPVLGLKQLDDVGAPLAAAIGRVHRVDRHVPAGVRGEPVVREHGIRRVARAVVVEQVHPHALVPQRRRRPRDLVERGGGDLRLVAGQVTPLERVVRRGLRVRAEAVRAHHHHRRGAWREVAALGLASLAGGAGRAPGEARGARTERQSCDEDGAMSALLESGGDERDVTEPGSTSAVEDGAATAPPGDAHARLQPILSRRLRGRPRADWRG